MQRPKLTARALDAAPRDTDGFIWCGLLPGFGVRLQRSGRRTFIARYRTLDGTQRSLTLGRCTDLSIDQARALARQVFADVAAGRDPSLQRQEARQAPTVADLHRRYMAEHAPYKKAASLVHDRRNWARHILPALGAKRVEAVTRADAMALHAGLSSHPATANHVRALLSKAMNLAIGWGWRTTANPIAGTPRFRIAQRECVLSPDQLAAVDAAIDRLVAAGRMRQPLADLFRLLALTGCRKSEIMTARRAWVDTHRGLLLLPDSKVGQRRVALPAAALDIIDRMPATTASGVPVEWLIPGRKPGHPVRQANAAWERVAREAGLPAGTRIHDLRHTAGSLGHRAGLTQRQIADMLGHRNLATTERYLHGLVADQQSAADVVARAVGITGRREPQPEAHPRSQSADGAPPAGP